MRMKLALLTITLLGSTVLAQLKTGTTVEAKRGETWEPATVVRVDGKLTLVRFKDGKQLFVGEQNVREAKPTPTAPPVAPTPDSPPARPRTPAAPEVAPAWPYPITDVVAGGKDLLPVGPEKWEVPALAPDPKRRIPAVLPPSPLPATKAQLGTPLVNGAKVLIGVEGEFDHGFAKTRRRKNGFIRVDAQTGANVAGELPPDCVVEAVSPSGMLMLTQSEGSGMTANARERARLDVFKVAAAPTHVVSFQPFDNDFKRAAFVSEDRIVVAGPDVLACYEIPSATLRWTISRSSMSTFDVAPDQRHVAVLTSEGVAIIDALEDKVVGVLDAPQEGRIAFAPDGSRLFWWSRPQLKGWDLKTGQSVIDTGVPDVEGEQSMIVVDKDFLLIGSLLFSVQQANFVWRYQGPRMIGGGGRAWVLLPDNKRRILTSAVLPHPKARQAVAKQAAGTPLLAPGMSVSLDINPEADPAKRERVIKELTQNLQKKGFKVEEGAPIRVVARTEAGKSEQHEYSVMGGGRQTVTVTQKITSLWIERDGKTLWKQSITSGGGAGMIVHLREGETIQGVLDRQNAVDPSWIGVTNLPTVTMPPISPDALPSSQWGLGGVKDQ